MNLTPEQIAARLAERNPFATRSVRPGAIPYRFRTDPPTAEPAHSEQTLRALVEALRRHDWRGEIVGPHGSGKSTLLQTLIPIFQECGRDVRLFTLHAGESRLPASTTDIQSWKPETLVIVDGYEQLGARAKKQLQRDCQRNQSGLLVTSHQPTGLPRLLQTAHSLEMTQAIVRDIQRCGSPRIHDRDVELSFVKHGGNIREVFFELYDLYEQRRA